jgi:N-glycosylase/DNA lyase
MEITIPTPEGFNFKRTAISHGWYDLPPFELDRERWVLTRVINVGGGRPITVEISEIDGGLKLRAPRKPARRQLETVIRDVRHIFRFDDDMSAFYALVARDADFAWVAGAGAGRLLRSPTVFEDLVKTICTTNCSWALTSKMVGALVSALGAETADGRRAFPTPEAMAAVDERFFRDEMRAGYRAPYFRELADRVAAREIDVESWLTTDKPTDLLKREMKRIKGVGDYAAENMLKLIGRYEGLALDSWVRAKFSRMHNKSRAADDKKIARYYSRFAPWQGLALWCDMTRDWLEDSRLLIRDE